MSQSVETKGLPYGADYAKTGRSNCKDKDCPHGGGIGIQELRLSARTRNKFHEGLQDNWFHFECFWKRARQNISEASIRNFEHLKWNDQERIRMRIKRKADLTDDAHEAKNARVEYAKSGRGSCMKCKKKINESDLRIEFHSSYYHPQCLASLQIYKRKSDEIDDYDKIQQEDQQLLYDLFTGSNSVENKSGKANKADEMTLSELKEARENASEESEIERLKELEYRKEALKKQTDLVWEVKDEIESAIANNRSLKNQKAKKEFVEKLVLKNGGNSYSKWTLDDLIQFLADIIVFGAFDACPECSATNFYYSPDRRVYQCAGAREDTKCSFFTKKIKRKPFKTTKDSGDLMKYAGKQLLPEGRVFSKAVEDGVEEEKLMLVAAAPSKKINVAQKRKKEPKGTMKKNGFSVDAYFRAGEDFHVYVNEDGDPYQFLLHKIDDKTGDKKFYKMQLLESDDNAEYRIFRRFGICLTNTTKDQVDHCDTLDDAIKLFEKMFYNKSNICWADRRKEQKPSKQKYNLVEWQTDLAGTYGRTSAETEADDDDDVPTTPTIKKPKKEGLDDEY